MPAAEPNPAKRATARSFSWWISLLAGVLLTIPILGAALRKLTGEQIGAA
jgi:hypothetical protein